MHIILVTGGLSQIESKWNAAALKLCKAMRKVWCIKGNNDDQKEDNDAKTDIVGWKPHWAQSRTGKAWLGGRNALPVGKQDTGLQNVPTRKRKDDQKRLALQQMQALRTPNPSAVTAATLVTRKRTAGRNIHTKPHQGVPQMLWERSWMKNYLCATLHKMRCPTSCKT
jgi:hypothetical protein